MPGYARRLRLMANRLEDSDDLLFKYSSEELEDFESEIDDLDEQLDRLVDAALEAQSDSDEEDPEDAA